VAVQTDENACAVALISSVDRADMATATGLTYLYRFVVRSGSLQTESNLMLYAVTDTSVKSSALRAVPRCCRRS
jgi:hypothetical protein